MSVYTIYILHIEEDKITINKVEKHTISFNNYKVNNLAKDEPRG